MRVLGAIGVGADPRFRNQQAEGKEPSDQFLADFGEVVFHPWWDTGVVSALDKALLLKQLQTAGKHLLRDDALFGAQRTEAHDPPT